MGELEINAFLTHLAVKERVSASTQNQALSALLFLYRHVLCRELGDFGEVIRARKPTRLPVVMTREEVKAVLAQLRDDKWLMASLMYGVGLRLMECLQLRVQDIDFARDEITVRDGKGAKDRVTMLPGSLKTSLQKHLQEVKAIHEKDLREGWGRVQMPDALDRKYPKASTEWRWQWVFPQEHRWKNDKTGEQGRHHVDESIVQKAFKQAIARAGLVKRATCHTLRHSAREIGTIGGNVAYHYVYILLSHKDHQFYTGYSSNLKKRLHEHSRGVVSSTKNRLPVTLIYWEGCLNRQDATRREKYLKTAWGKRYLKNRLKHYLTG